MRSHFLRWRSRRGPTSRVTCACAYTSASDWNVLPIRERTEGLSNDGRCLSTPQAIAFDRIEAPTLVVSTKETARAVETARLIAKRIPDARLVTYRTGGHFWIGHDRELLVEVVGFAT